MTVDFSLQKRQTFLRCFFCQPFSSFSLFGLRSLDLGIQRRLLLRSAHSDGDVPSPVASSRAPSLLLDLRRSPLQAGTDLLGLDLHLGPPLPFMRLPRV